MKHCPKVHVYLHQMGIDTKVYKKYVEDLQNQIDANFYKRVLREKLREYARPSRGLYDIYHAINEWFHLEAVWYYVKDNYSIPEVCNVIAREYLK